jgi:hypothetical protein
MEMVQEALEVSPQGSSNLLSPAQVDPALLIEKTMICHHFHQLKNQTIVIHPQYHITYRVSP